DAVRLTEHAGLHGEWLWTLVHVWQATVRLLRGSPADAVPLLDRALVAARRREDPLAILAVRSRSVPTGKVLVRDKGRTIARARLAASDRGRVTVRLPKLRRGKHVLVVRYQGSPTVAASSSAARSVRLR
ncbi:Ig-like domain-containing protein, partial [uncultured Nocardioides sp.]|uniref:Ig-like domain-containing protein n=1 Tax=uncultured Nocardioides sp. TaxID=198441 RepID=UPI0025FB2D85